MPFPAELCRGPPKDFEIKFVLNNGRNKFSLVAHVGYDISPLSRVEKYRNPRATEGESIFINRGDLGFNY